MKKTQPTKKQQQPRQRTLLESLELVDNAPKPSRRVPGQQRSLDTLGKVVKRNPNESPEDTMARNLAILEDYRTSCEKGSGGRGGGNDEGEQAATTATIAETPTAETSIAAAASTAASLNSAPAKLPRRQQEERVRLALRELSCVRGVNSSLIAASGAGVALRALRRSPHVAASLAVQAEKILDGWKVLVTSEVRARRKYMAHAAAAGAAASDDAIP